MSQFIPKLYKKETISMRIEKDKLEKIDLLAASAEMSRNAFLNQCIDYALENQKNKVYAQL